MPATVIAETSAQPLVGVSVLTVHVCVPGWRSRARSGVGKRCGGTTQVPPGSPEPVTRLGPVSRFLSRLSLLVLVFRSMFLVQ